MNTVNWHEVPLGRIVANSLGQEIRRLADAKGLVTHQAVADAAGLSQSFVTRLLSGQRPNLTAEVLYKLSDALGVGCDHWRPYFAPDQSADLPGADPTPELPPGPPPPTTPPGRPRKAKPDTGAGS